MNEPAKPTVMFYVQHLLGIGHVFRAVRVAQALARAGCETHVVWGGTKIESLNTDGLQMTYLEAVRVQNEDFKTLLKTDGTPISEAEKEQRGRNLLDLFYKVKPDIVITEAYPFGRRQMRFELLPLLQAVKNAGWHPMMVSSIRDIMQENRVEKRVRESIDLIKNWFDLVMVHGDESLISVGETLQNTGEIADKIVHTGLVTPTPVDMDVAPSIKPDVLVSAGGGAVGLGLMKVAIEAMKHCKKFPTNWVLVTGPDLPQQEFDQLLHDAPSGMKVIRFIPDLARVMAASMVSVSRAGYNTVGDILRAGTRAVLVPFAGGIETEQLRRAQMMDERGVATLHLEDDLTPENLAKSIDIAADKPVAVFDLDLNGANNAAKMLIETHKNHRTK
ncbi:MAG: glycosyltransferase [Rhizobiaceae bacterium]